MNNTTIADTLELPKKAPVNQITVTIKKAFEPQEGEGQYGPWRIQAAMIKDETGELRATFWNRFNIDLRNMEGEELTIISGRDGKDKFSGILTDDYKGKRQLKISEDAKLTSLSSDNNPESESTEQERDEQDKAVEAVVTGRRFVSEHEKRESIEKQVALKAAVEFYNGDDKANVDSVIKAASEFYKFLHESDQVI